MPRLSTPIFCLHLAPCSNTKPTSIARTSGWNLDAQTRAIQAHTPLRTRKFGPSWAEILVPAASLFCACATASCCIQGHRENDPHRTAGWRASQLGCCTQCASSCRNRY
ncbi:hypothetical protein HYPSUDRAFT_409841 [Hypholoma sublateritium FD-334 SS-4]|uniref:Uncharacterized protein n=1 Tax=Hypholoma sublateritium (strain FD-334 SS-4) TaxID=945553 RepID=A0A0D2LDY2_HYPSF|nr:hypothetical protein HYPSUDRAFT_409841 [Hypholoma sublateritium FD-334 SS-4]